MSEFQDITLINKDDTPIIAEQKRQMNESIVVEMDKVYPNHITCICGKKVIHYAKHLESSKHRRFVKKNGINIEIRKPPEKPKKVKGPRGRPKKYDYSKNETPEEKRERNRKYMLDYFDDNEEKRIAHNIMVTKYREENREKCREAVRRSRAKKKELARLAEAT